MSASPVAAFEQFNWQPQPQAQALVNDVATVFLDVCSAALPFAEALKHKTGTRLIDWLDFVEVPLEGKPFPGLRTRLEATGFVLRPIQGAPNRYVNEGGVFPPFLLSEGHTLRLGIKVDSVADFLAVHHECDTVVEGDPLAQMRRAVVFRGKGDGFDCEMMVVKRHGWNRFDLPEPDPVRGMVALGHLEAFRLRHRDFSTDEAGLAHVHTLVDSAVSDLGPDRACHLFFMAEREYWQSRNHAAQVQKRRQDSLGLGWANHDHHTYRSSRRHFTQLIALWEKLGLHCRERFYAGAEAGWGAQVMEQPVTGIVTFNDVDMSPEELLSDFAHEPMPKRAELGTVGLWCALHGEALLEAGMHHLECMFDWHELKVQLEHEHVRTMSPFTTFPYLRQAFTEGERWTVASERIDRLLGAGLITDQQAEQFRRYGAIGSHLENLERNDGFKGFNQQGVSEIIARTDPRRLVSAEG